MASSINPSNIDGTYPVAGQDNDSQGFRDNFTNVKTNFTSAKTEIEALQTSSVSLTATNDFNFTGTISEALMKNNADVVNALGTLTAVAMDHATAIIHTATLGASGTVSFTNWPASGSGGRMRLILTIANVAHTLTLPAAVTLGADTVKGISSLVITFPAAGTYIYDFSTVDGGTSVLVEDKTQSDTTLGDIIISGGVVTGATSITSTAFVGALTGNATTATTVANITVADTTDTTSFVGLWESATGSQAPKSDAGLTYNAGTGMLTATGLTGPLTGNVTGNVTGNASGTALTVTQPAQSSITSLGTLTVLAVDNLSFDANTITTTNSNGDLGLNPNGTGTVDFSVPVQTTVGSAGGASAVPAAPTTYMKIEVGGTAYVVPCFAVS